MPTRRMRYRNLIACCYVLLLSVGATPELAAQPAKTQAANNQAAKAHSSTQVRWDQERLRTILEQEVIQVSRIAAHPVLVTAVVAQNAQNLTMLEIGRRDEMWQSSADNESLKLSMLNSVAAEFLRSLVGAGSSYTEAFITDAQGANVAVAPLTSDYWQGDEDKFRKVTEVPGGVVFIGPMEWDESSNFNSVQISVPIKQGDVVIGVMVVGVKLSHILARQLEDMR